MKRNGYLIPRYKTTPVLIVVGLIIIALVAGAIFHSHSLSERKARRALRPRLLPVVTFHPLDNSRTLVQYTPSHSVKTIVIATPAGTKWDTKTLRKLSFDAAATLVTIELPVTDCQSAMAEFDERLQQFAPTANIVIGLNEDSILAKRWLSFQQEKDAIAVGLSAEGSTIFNLDLCPSLTTSLEGNDHWHEVSIDGLKTRSDEKPVVSHDPAPQSDQMSAAINRHLRTILNITRAEDFNKLPLIELPAQGGGDTLTIFYSGDGGWRGLDKKISEHLSGAGISVVGVDALEYFWDLKPAEMGASDLSEIMQHYRQAWGVKHFVLAGYSFGADVLPALYNRLPFADQSEVDSLVLISFARQANFEIRIEGIMGQDVGKYATGPEMASLPPHKVACIYGTDESRKSGCTEATAVGTVLPLVGNHHFNDDFDIVSTKMLQFIQRR